MIPIKSRKRQQKADQDNDKDSDVSSDDGQPHPQSHRRGGAGGKRAGVAAGNKAMMSTAVVRRARPMSPSRLNHILTVMEKKTYKMKSKEELLQDKIESLFVAKRKQMLALRVKASKVEEAIKFTIAGDEYRLRREIELGFDVNLRDALRGRTILHEACAHGHFHIVRMLCRDYKHALDIDRKTYIGQVTAMHLAVEFNFRQIAAMLITSGATMNVQDKHGNTPLHYVKSMTLLKLLLKTDIDVAIRNKAGETALEYYLKTVLEEDHDKNLIDILRSRESSRMLELVREKIKAEEEFREREMTRAAWINQNESHASRIGRNNKINMKPIENLQQLSIKDDDSVSKASNTSKSKNNNDALVNVNHGRSMGEPPLRKVIIDQEFINSKRYKS